MEFFIGDDAHFRVAELEADMDTMDEKVKALEVELREISVKLDGVLLQQVLDVVRDAAKVQQDPMVAIEKNVDDVKVTAVREQRNSSDRVTTLEAQLQAVEKLAVDGAPRLGELADTLAELSRTVRRHDEWIVVDELFPRRPPPRPLRRRSSLRCL